MLNGEHINTYTGLADIGDGQWYSLCIWLGGDDQQEESVLAKLTRVSPSHSFTRFNYLPLLERWYAQEWDTRKAA